MWNNLKLVVFYAAPGMVAGLARPLCVYLLYLIKWSVRPYMIIYPAQNVINTLPIFITSPHFQTIAATTLPYRSTVCS